MAKGGKDILELEVKSNIGEVTEGVDKAAKSTKNLAKQTEKVDDATKETTKGFRGLGTAIKGVGTALKAVGIGLAIALFAKLVEVFSQNQKVVDFFNTSMTALSIAFNDLFGFLEKNISTVSGYFKSVFEDPQLTIKNFGDTIKKDLIGRFNSFLETIGFLASAIKKLFARDFKGAIEDTKLAVKESLDIVTGVDNSVEKLAKTMVTGVNAIKEYVTETYNSAQAITETTKSAEKAAVIFAKLNAEFLRDAELQRQIRDDETKTFAERIEANENLSKTLEKQQKLQREQLDIQEKAAQLQYDINNSDENWILLQETKVAKLELEETITGQLSEQKTNQVALEKELLETQNEVRAEGLSGMERELQELETAYDLKLEMARKSGMDITAITKQYEKQKKLVVQAGVDEQIEAYAGLAGTLGKLAGDNKELAIAEALMNTYVAINKVMASSLPYPANIIASVATGIQGFMNVQQIMNTKIPGGGGGGAAPPAATPAPQMMSGAFELTGGQETEPIQAYVVSDEITDSQNALAIIRRRATI